MNAAQALLRELRRDQHSWAMLHPDLRDAIREELEHADTTDPDEITEAKDTAALARIKSWGAGLTAGLNPGSDEAVEPDSPRGRYTYPPPDPRLRGLRFEAEES